MATPVSGLLRLQPARGDHPLWDDSAGAANATAIDPTTIGLSDQLIHRLQQWNTTFQGVAPEPATQSLLAGKPSLFVWRFTDIESERAWYAQGLLIASDLRQALQQIWTAHAMTGKLVVRISNLETLIKRAMGTQSPWEWKSEDHVQEIGQQCAVPEIGRAIERLDELSVARAQTPDWDGDTNDDIAKAQLMFGQILGAVSPIYLDDIAQGLTSTEADTRFYVGYALAKHGQQALPWLRQALERETNPVTRTTLEMLVNLIE